MEKDVEHKKECFICGGTGMDKRTIPQTECNCKNKGYVEHDFDLSFRERTK